MSETSGWTVNEVVSHNLARARRRAGWTQEEAASRLSAATGRKWTKNSVGAAERAREVGRPREFNADELMAFSRLFGLPVAFFFLPPASTGKDQEFRLGPDGEAVTRLGLLSEVLLFRPDPVFLSDAAEACRVHDLSWSPSRPSWYRPEEELGAEAGEEREAAEGLPSADGVVDEAKRRRVLELLEELRRLVVAEDGPPF